MVHSQDMTIEERLHEVEQRLDRLAPQIKPGALSLHSLWAFVLGLAALTFGYLGLGLPQHYYQVLFAALLVLLLYHRRFLLMPQGGWRWPQIMLNFALLCLLFKLLIGGGMAYPFDWLNVPALSKTPPPGGGSWYSRLVPDYTVQWQGIPTVSGWSVDLTKIQTLFLIATLAGALFRFQPFTSLTALALLIISIPTYLAFNWDWVILFLVIGSVSIYLQSKVNAPPGGMGEQRN
jgi:hypothetical protein